MQAAVGGIVAKKDSIPIGFTKAPYDKFEREREAAVGPAWEKIRETMGGAHQL